ncbi:MAG: tetratricopeptide repeat protein [Hyalangium sp.]|uniref:tetratricopeptide repeat protein n=1 Tax=Hyalangium sp. TaxID=2028555 RepID=UPI003899CFC0
MGGVRNGKSEPESGAPEARQETLAVNGPPPGAGGGVQARVGQHLQVAFRLLRERQAPKAFGELVRASRSLPMTRRLASALVTVSLRAGTEAAAITLLTAAFDKTEGAVRRDVGRQLARVLRRVDQLPRAIEALEAVVAAFPEDHAARRVLQLLLERTGRWEALVASLDREALEAFQRGEYSRAARAASWRARIQAEQLRNLARAAESYGQAANYLEQMEDAVGAFTIRLDGLRVLHASGASEPVLTAAASVCMSAAARLGRDAQARQVLEDLGLIPKRTALTLAEAPREPSTSAEASPAGPAPEARIGRSAATVEMSLPLLQAMLAASTGQLVSASPEASKPATLEAEAPAAPSPEPSGPAAAASESPTTPSPVSAEAAAPQAEPAPVAVTSFESPKQAAPEPPPAEAAVSDEASEEFAAPGDEQEDEALSAEEGVPLTELFEIPEEEAPHSEPPVFAAEENPEEEVEPEPEEPPPPAEPVDDAAAQQRLEAQLIARKSWRELAQFYLARADRAKDPGLRAEALTRLAELMENELSDPSGAARIYREIVTLTGDRDALKEQVRLLAQRGDPTLVRRALDEAVQSARTPKARAAAHLTRAERSLEAGEPAQAKADFETAEALTPGMLLVLAGLVRCVPNADRPMMASRLRSALAAAPRRAPDRLDALRTLASVAEDSLKDARLAQWAWTEVLSEEPGEGHARERLLVLARELRDKGALGQLLREQLAREPRGPAARLARMELVSALEDAGDMDGALTELRQAVRFEPGHKEAWLLLADRLTERGQIGEAAWALDNAASAMEDEAERLRTWIRLASFCHNVLKDPVRAEMYSRRAENLRRSLEDKSAPPVPELPRSAPPPRRDPGPTGARTQILIPPPGSVELTPSGQSFPPTGDESKTDIHEPAQSLPDHSRPTIEFSAVTFPGDKMPFADEEPTATEAPEGFVPPGSEPAKAAASSEKASPPASAPKKNLGKKLKIEKVDPSRELDSLLGQDQEESDHTSPYLSAWSMKRPPQLSKPPKDSAPSKPPAAGGRRASSDKVPAAKSSEKATARMRKVRPGQRDESPPPPPPPEPEAPPARARPPVMEDTAPGRRAAMKPPPREAASNSTGSRPALAASAQASGASKAASTPKRQEPAESAFAQVSPQEPEGPPAYSSAPVQHTSFISWEAPPGKMEPVRRVARARGAPTAPKAPPPESPGAEPAVFKKVREYPLDDKLYLQIAEYFENRGDTERAELMREIADAIEGRESSNPRPPRQPLSTEDRFGLRHPTLRSPAGELLACVGVALCRLFPVHGRAAGTNEPLRANLGPGAPAAMEALEATERLFGTRVPEVVLSEDNGPPFSLVFTNSPRLLVGKQAVRQVLPAAELRFYAGRALICLGPDLLALRSLKKDQVLRGLALLSTVLKDGKATSLEARVVRETLEAHQLEQAAALYGPATRQFDVSAMADAARDSANRAGLIACGAVGPALAALKMKRALEREVVELVRFAASERYFQLRTTR